MIERQSFKEIIKNFLYRTIKGEVFSFVHLIERAKKEFKDLQLKIRYDKDNNSVKELFITFNDRLSDSIILH